MLSKTSLDNLISGSKVTLTDMKLVGLSALPTGTSAADFTVALAVDTTAGTSADG